MDLAPCEHLEALLPQEETGTLYNRSFKDVDRISVEETLPFGVGVGFKDEEDLRASLAKHHLAEHEVEVLVERFVHNRTFKQIKEDLGFTAISAVHGIYHRTLDKLRSQLERKA